jgi:outer membrane receptor for ferrienterochelin and colicins
MNAAVPACPVNRRGRRFASPVFVTAALVLLAPASGAAQSVWVRTLGPAGPLEGTRVEASGQRVLTDSAGMARLRLPLGTHTVTATRIGFATESMEVVLSQTGDTTLVIRMREEAIEGEEIVVTSTRSERRIEEEPIRIEVVSREEVEEKVLMTPGDISMLLNETSGLRVQPTAPSLGGASVRIQGLRGRYTQILSDGLPLYGGQAGALGPLQVPPMDLAQVEVIKGAASALYGPTALGGVVNLISRRPEPARELLLNQSTLDGTDLVGWLADEVGERWGYTLLASAHRQEFADVDADGWADVPRFQRLSVRPRLFWNDDRGTSVMATVGGMTEDRTGGTLPERVTPEGLPFTESLDTRRFDGGLRVRRLLGSSRVLTARASGFVQGHEHRYGSTVEDDEHRTGFAELALSGHDGRHLWVLGLAFQHDAYENAGLPAFDFAYRVPSVFAQDELALSGWLTVAGSVRWDQHNRFGGALSPRLSFLARTGEWTTRLSGGTGFFAPTPFTEETEAVGLSRVTAPAGWTREEARSGMIDVGRQIGPVEFNVSAFTSLIDAPLQTVRSDSGLLTVRNGDDRVHTWGTEVFAALRTGPWRLVGSHSYLRSTEPDPGDTARREVPLTPRHSAGLIGAYEQEGRGRVGIEAYYTGRQELDDDPYRDASRRHFILGFLVDRRLGRFRVFLNAENVLDTRQTRWAPLVRPGRTPDGRWLTDVWAPLEGRAFNAGIWLSL